MTLKRATAPPVLGGGVWKVNSPKITGWCRRTRSRSVASTSTWGSVGVSASMAVLPLLSPLSSKGQFRSSLVVQPRTTRCKKFASCCDGTSISSSSSTSSLPSPCGTPKSPSKRQSMYSTLLGSSADSLSQSLNFEPMSKRQKRLTTLEIDRELEDFLCDNHNVAALLFSSSNSVCDTENMDMNLPGQVPASSSMMKKGIGSTACKTHKYGPIETPPLSPQNMNRFTPRSALLSLKQATGQQRPVHTYREDTARVENKIKLLRKMKQMIETEL